MNAMLWCRSQKAVNWRRTALRTYPDNVYISYHIISDIIRHNYPPPPPIWAVPAAITLLMLWLALYLVILHPIVDKFLQDCAGVVDCCGGSKTKEITMKNCVKVICNITVCKKSNIKLHIDYEVHMI